jgi:hypothetical protein
MRERVAKVRRRAARALLLLLALICYAPQLLAFPYSARFGQTVARSEAPIPPRFAGTLMHADALVARSPLHAGPVPRSIFLTSGGGRWRLLSIGSGGAFAVRRPLRNLIILNRTDAATDRVDNGTRTRALHDTLAHETNILITDHFGTLRAMTFPIWKVEGYADYVAGASFLDDAAAARMRTTDPRNSALTYYDGHKRVAAALARDPDVDDLFL